MSKDFSSTHLGRRPASPEDEREVLLRAGQALLAARLHELDEREVVFAVADFLDRANYVLETSVDITVLGGAQGTYVNGRRFDLVPERPDAAFELKDGFPARGLAGFRVTAALDQESLRAFLAAWRVEPTGPPREALERFREVHDGERAGRGLPPEGPLEVVLLPSDGKLPLPLVPPPAAVGPLEDEGDDAPPPAADDDDRARSELARLAQRGSPTHGKTARRHAKDVIPEDLGSATPHPVPSGTEQGGDAPTAEAHGYESAATSPPEEGEGAATGADGATGGGEGESPSASPASSWAAAESKSPSASSWVAKSDSPSGSSWASKSGTKSPSGSGWASKSGIKSPSGSSWAGKDPAASWIKDAAEEATEGGDASAEYGAAIEALANATQVRPAGDVISQDLQAALKRAAAKALGDDPVKARPPRGEPPPEPADPETADLVAARPETADLAATETGDLAAAQHGAADPEAAKSSTSVRPASEVIGEDLAERADSSAVRRAVASSEDDMERVGSSTAVRSADAATAPVPAEAEEGAAPAESTPVRLEAPASSAIEDLSPEASKASLVYARLVSRTGRALSAGAPDYDRALAAVRRSAVEILNGLAQTPFEDRLLALTAFPAPDDRARHGANTAIYSVLAGRACGLAKVPLADLCVAAALHDDGETDAEGRVDRWPRALARILGATTVSDTTLLRTVLAYERTGPKGSVARPSPGSKTARLEARIVACASAFDEAVTGTGDYPGIRADLALERLGPAGHDAAAVKALAAALGAYPRGVLVTLAPSGDRAVVLACGGRRNDRPRVRIFADANGAPIDVREVEMSSAYSDLSVERIEDDAALGVDAKAHLMAWG